MRRVGTRDGNGPGGHAGPGGARADGGEPVRAAHEPGEGPAPLPPIGALIAAARRYMTRVVLERVARHGVTAQQFWLVVAIHDTPEISQVEISDRTLADTASISRALSDLLARGLVEIAPDPGDRRRSRVRLTSAGERLAAELVPIARELREARVAGMSPAELGAFRSSVRRLLANRDRVDGPAEAADPA